MDEKIGVVLGSRPATPVDFYIAVDRNKTIQLDDAVFLQSKLRIKDQDVTVSFYGIVDSVERSYEGLDFDSDMYHIESVSVEERYVAHVKITMIEPEILTPPRPGDPVFLARCDRFEKAIGARNMPRRIPAGLSLTTEEVVYIDLDFVDGKKGAHINISGISGVATKTTYGIFLLHEIMRYSEESKQKGLENDIYTGVVFSVKGEDLLFMDKPNKRLYPPAGPEEKEAIEIWPKLSKSYKDFIERKVGLSNFKIRFYAPPMRSGGKIIPAVHQRARGETHVFGWSILSFLKHGLIRYAISEDETENVKYLIEEIGEILKALADYTEKRGTREYVINPFNKNEKIERFKDVVKFTEMLLHNESIQPVLEEMEIKERIRQIRSKYNWNTKKACIRRIHGISSIGNLIGPEFAREETAEKYTDDKEERSEDTSKILDLGNIKMHSREIHVFHISQLDEVCQKIVVGSILSRIFEQQSKEGSSSRKVLVFLDELSKYAPREGSSPIKNILEEIAERGRSLGVILIGAQQSARTVSRKVIMNSAIKVIGRMSSEEIESDEYGFLTRELKMRLLIARPGRMVISQPGVFAPIMIKFPFPFWATRKEEEYTEIAEIEREIQDTLETTYG